MVFFVVSTSGAEAITSTDSRTDATCSVMSMRASCPVVSVMPLRLWTTNPLRSALSS